MAIRELDGIIYISSHSKNVPIQKPIAKLVLRIILLKQALKIRQSLVQQLNLIMGHGKQLCPMRSRMEGCKGGLDAWKKAGGKGLKVYEPGSEGPEEANDLLERDGRTGPIHNSDLEWNLLRALPLQAFRQFPGCDNDGCENERNSNATQPNGAQ